MNYNVLVNISDNNTRLYNQNHSKITENPKKITFLDLSKNAFLICSSVASDFTPRSS